MTAKADFAVTSANMRAIAEICAQLEGLPLAIELAAACIAPGRSIAALLADAWSSEGRANLPGTRAISKRWHRSICAGEGEGLEESIMLYREIGHRKALAESLAILARVVMVQGDGAAARAFYEESLTLARELNHLWLITSCLEGCAALVAQQGQFAWAAQLWGAAESLRTTIGVPLPAVERADYERAVAAARAALREGIFAARWAEGRSMAPEQALAAQGKIVSPPATASTAPATSSAGLTPREVEVLRLVALGMTNTQIAHKLIVSEKTVATHLTHIFNKTNSENRAAATAFAIRHGLV